MCSSERVEALVLAARLRQGLEESLHHGERRAQLVGDVRDEVAAHRLHPFPARHVAREQQLLVVAVGHELHGQDALIVSHALQRERLAVELRVEIAREHRVADEVGDGLLPVALQGEAEVVLGRGVHPLDAVLAVENHDAPGHRLARLAEAPHQPRKARLALALLAQDAVEPGVYLRPPSFDAGNVLRPGVGQPALQARLLAVLDRKRGEQDEQGHGGVRKAAEYDARHERARAGQRGDGNEAEEPVAHRHPPGRWGRNGFRLHLAQLSHGEGNRRHGTDWGQVGQPDPVT
jgi:hypothetical protein